MEDFHHKLDKYAELAVKVGVNVQPGQTLVIVASLDAADFVRRVATKAFEAGAKDIHVDWSDETITRTRYLHATDEALESFPEWRARGFEDMAKSGAAILYVDSANPDSLKGISPDRIAKASRARAVAMKNYNAMTQSAKVSWSIVAVPSEAWAQKVFPDLDTNAAMEKLWENIFLATRANLPDPVSAWRKHIEALQRYLNTLNERRYKALHYRAPGTNLTVELPTDHLWVGGGLTNATGTYFVPNMPTEEVFSLPLRNGVHGTVASTKPLSYSGQVIENFSLTLERGKVVSFTAEKGFKALEKLFAIDDGARHFGEVALVPCNSPIAQLDVTFQNTLFDENASCHFALGNAYPLCIKGGTEMSKDELEQHGANTSLTHVDFMIGSNQLEIDGETQDGVLEPLFRQGNWAI